MLSSVELNVVLGFEMRNVDGGEFNILEKASLGDSHVLLMQRLSWQIQMHNNV